MNLKFTITRTIRITDNYNYIGFVTNCFTDIAFDNTNIATVEKMLKKKFYRCAKRQINMNKICTKCYKEKNLFIFVNNLACFPDCS